MDPRLLQPWIPPKRIEAVVQLEPALMILVLGVIAWLVYKLFLRGVSAERHRNLRRHFWNLLLHLIIGSGLFVAYSAVQYFNPEMSWIGRLNPYVGLCALLWGALVFVKIARIMAFEYLFLSHMRVGVPLLIVNIFTLALSIIVGVWIVTSVFGIKLAPILATSAVLSIVLGLAMQDTLGNLFAGVALQFDKPYEIGDWVEISGESQRWVGQIEEISWRGTILLGLSDELITLPNRTVAQSEIANFSAKHRPILRRQLFRIPFDCDPKKVKEALVEAARSVPAVRSEPAPFVLVTDNTDSWLEYKLLYFITDYGTQYMIADKVITAAVESLHESGIPLAAPRVNVSKSA